MTDRELLEAAANANGQPWKWVKVPAYATEVPGVLMRDHAHEVDYYPGWNPLENDGDALRLAVKLKLCLTVRDSDTRAHKYGSNSKRRQHHESQGDPYAATRRAIVRAAAIGAHKEGA